MGVASCVVTVRIDLFVQARLTGIHGYDFDMRSHPITFRYDESTVKSATIIGPLLQF